RGEIGFHFSYRPPFNVGDWRNRIELLISPLVGEMSGRTEGGAKDHEISWTDHAWSPRHDRCPASRHCARPARLAARPRPLVAVRVRLLAGDAAAFRAVSDLPAAG